MFDVYGLLCEFAFNKLKVKKITLHSEVDNIAAIITFKKLGFKIEKTLKNHLFKNDRYINIIRFGYPYEDYIKNKIEK
jgi:RimJ/RimL family protein N-acetyltransferase